MFVAGENIDSAMVRRLREDGHNVVWIAESDPGITDDRVLAIAEDQSRVVITSDANSGNSCFARDERVRASCCFAWPASHPSGRR